MDANVNQTAPADRDDRLAELLECMMGDLRAGKSPDVERLAREHPQLSTELRELWAAVMIADAMALRSSQFGETELRWPERLQIGDQGNLPIPPDERHNVEATSGTANVLHVAESARLPRRIGDYEHLTELGRGGMGVVYQARQVSLDRMVAVKMILRGSLASAADLARFRSEAESVARLDHPGIVPIYEIGDLDGQPFFSMKFVAGTTLARRLIDGPMRPREAAELLAPISRAIHFAHQQGVLHRDLKPSNILIDLEGRPHVTDFGLAKRITEERGLTNSGAIVGTPSYMAPEQAAGTRGEIGPASDVYSLGAILYAMLTGRPPFQAASPVDTVLMVLEQDPLPPRLVNVKADRDLEMIALMAMQKPAELRYPSALALAEDLEAYLAGEPISARSGAITQVVARLFRETHHATVLRNWGLLWMWHSVVLLAICLVTNDMSWRGVDSRWPYLALWAGGLFIWAPIFCALRRRAGPVTAIERQIAHLWGASVVGSILLFVVEWVLGEPVLRLAPVLGLLSGMVFLVKAAMLNGVFYLQAAALFLTALVMARWPGVAHTTFGVVSALCFFIPGWKYYQQRRMEM
jgi:eukaryotic-like serine/threonine-protein kinase